jgi:hypothetical protein
MWANEMEVEVSIESSAVKVLGKMHERLAKHCESDLIEASVVIQSKQRRGMQMTKLKILVMFGGVLSRQLFWIRKKSCRVVRTCLRFVRFGGRGMMGDWDRSWVVGFEFGWVLKGLRLFSLQLMIEVLESMVELIDDSIRESVNERWFNHG